MTKWRSVPLSELCDIRIGKTPARKTPEFWTPGVEAPWVTISDLKQGRLIRTSKETVSEAGVRAARMKLVPKGTLLLSFKLSIGKLGIAERALYTNEAIAALADLSSDVDRDYLYWAFQHINLLETSDRAAKGKTLNKAKLSRIPIPLPPLPEQRRIAAILDKADALRQKRREAIAKLDKLLQSVFLEMFGDPFINPKKWPSAVLDEVVSIDAPLVDPRNDAYKNLLHYGPDRISSDAGRLLPAKTAAEDALISKKFLCDERHVLYSKIRPYLNKVAVVEENCLCSADVYPVEPIGESIEKSFLWTALRTSHFLEHASSFSNRANIPKLNRKQFLSYKFPLPPIDLQKRYATMLEKLLSISRQYSQSAASLDTFFGSLQQKAFTGQL